MVLEEARTGDRNCCPGCEQGAQGGPVIRETVVVVAHLSVEDMGAFVLTDKHQRNIEG